MKKKNWASENVFPAKMSKVILLLWKIEKLFTEKNVLKKFKCKTKKYR